MKTLSPKAVATLVVAVLTAAISLTVATAAPAETGWTGLYLGVTGGYGWARPTAELGGGDNDMGRFWFNLPLKEHSYSVLGRGGTFGGQVGYNYQFAPAWLAGLVTDFSYSNISGTSSIETDHGGGNPARFDYGSKLEWFGTFRAKIGYLPKDNLMVYGTGGLAYGKTTANFSHTNLSGTTYTYGVSPDGTFILCAATSTPCLAGTNSRTSFGWSVGAGAEMKVTRDFNLSAEYLYVNLGRTTVHMATVSPSSGAGAPTAVFSENFHILRVALSYQFH